MWTQLKNNYSITDQQFEQFQKYLTFLLQENEKYNLTAIVETDAVILDHFQDSLALIKDCAMPAIEKIIDVGSGGGFPGIPLAIVLPHVQFCLIEVNLKKVHFLNLVIEHLQLKNVTVCTLDWRTFLRSALVQQWNNNVLVVARASLPVEELLRMFRPSSQLNHATLVYWASKKWLPSVQEKEYLDHCNAYSVGHKERQLCYFKRK
ncbi:16S rRNA (guanine(527)-N(7))-methyltransferase RsmG [Candidatus Babeliales bacterium]|nr:16S rRNA (guanine(527)-N(7))-methyltransferase RsmG [Candidatus Babeliales bacterium]